MAINTKLSLKGCWEMVNRIQLAHTPEEIRKRASIAGEWLKANEVVSNAEYDDLMMAVSYIVRESYNI